MNTSWVRTGDARARRVGFGAIYLAGSAALGGLFIAAAVRLHRQADRASALRLYLYLLRLPGRAVRSESSTRVHSSVLQ